jgi:RHS repeat-associated protein
MGQLHDDATGLGHHRFRVFDPESARFVSPDPLGIAGGGNAFVYPTDPITLADPLGLARCRVTGKDYDNASDMPIVRPGSKEWSKAVRSLQSGGKGDIRVQSIADGKQLLKESRGNMDRRKRWTTDPYTKGYEVHPDESFTANAPGNNLPHMKWKDWHAKEGGSGHVFFSDPWIQVQ